MKIANHPGRKFAKGFTLAEMLGTIAIVGVIAGLAVVGFGNVTGQAKDRIARNLVETLNKGTRNFSHANWDLKFNAVDAVAGDEMMVLRSLQWREPDGDPNQTESIYRGPYVRDDWNPQTSSDIDTWRIQWTGSAWKLLLPGTPGAGLLVDFEGADLGTPYKFPDNFNPVGSK